MSFRRSLPETHVSPVCPPVPLRSPIPPQFSSLKLNVMFVL